MPKFQQGVGIASGMVRTPGKWLCEIRERLELPGGKSFPGVEQHDRNGQIAKTKNGDELWKICMVVTDDHPDAPVGQPIFDNWTWDGKAGQRRCNGALKAMGWPVEAWEKETDPSRIPEITPSMLLGKPFVFDSKLNDSGYLEAAGFMPYLPPTAKRGPAPGSGGGSSGSGKSKPKPTVPTNGAAGGKIVDDSLPF